MTRLLRVLALVVAVVLIGIIALRQSPLARVGVDMHGRVQQGRPWFGLHDVGFGLEGESVTTPVADWSFVNAARSVKIQVTPWWGIPYTLNTAIAASQDGARVYLFSDYLAPAPGRDDLRGQFPVARGWNRHILRHPRIRVQVSRRVFEFLAYPLTDETEIESARAAFLANSPMLAREQAGPEADRPRMYIVRLIPQWGVAAVRDAHARAANGLDYLATHPRP